MFSSVLEVAIGVITAFSGGLGNIPPGWHLCDGSNGTPDLRDRFTVATGPTFSVDDTGGSTSHDHDFTANGHTHSPMGIGDITVGAQVAQATTSTPITGTTNPTANLPKYYALAYIMYIGVN